MDELAKRGIMSRSIDLPFSGFADDVACVRSAIESMARDGAVHVVGHSYSGLVLAAGGHAAAHLTFIAARLPLAGESPASHTEEWGYPEFRACMVPDDDGVVRLTDDARPLMYHRTSSPLADFAMAHRRPMSSVVPDEPVADPAWMTVPSSYAVCGDDRAVRPAAQRERAALVGASTELDTDHSPFFSGPAALAGFLAAQHVRMAA
jgi:pimeloyl-ACP methyl ester carboxylesterase